MGIARGARSGPTRRRNKTREGYNHDCTKIPSDSLERAARARTDTPRAPPKTFSTRPRAPLLLGVFLANAPLGRGRSLPSLVSILCASSFLFLPCGEDFLSWPGFRATAARPRCISVMHAPWIPSKTA